MNSSSTTLRSGRDDNSIVGINGHKRIVIPTVVELLFTCSQADVILRMVLVVLAPLTVGTISTRPPQVVISSAPTMFEAA